MTKMKTGLLAACLLFTPHVGCAWRTVSAGPIYPRIPVPAGEVPEDDTVRQATRMIADGHPALALALLRGAASAHPEWPPVQLILARMLSAAGQTPQSLKALEQAAAESPEDPRVFQCFAALALADGRLSDARLNCEKILAALEKAKLDATAARHLRREAQAGLAAVAEAHDDWPGAVLHFRAWLADDSKNATVRRRYGLALFRNGKAEDAFSELKQAALDDPKLEPAGLTMAWLWGKAGNARKAGEWFDYAHKIDPRDLRIPLAKARWLIDEGRAGEAEAPAAEAETLAPHDRAVALLRGLIAWHLRNFDAAERTLEVQHREAPADLTVADLLARSLIEQDDSAKQMRGLELAEVNARQAPRSAETLITLGRAHYRLGHRAQAEKLLRASIVDGQASADAAYYLAQVLADNQRNDEARALLQTVVVLRGGFVFKDQATRLLASLAAGSAAVQPASARP